MIELSTLQKITLFEGLSEKQLRKLQKILRVHTAKENDVIIRDGEKGHEVFILLEGEVQISKQLTTNLPQLDAVQQDKSIIRLSAKDHAFFGEMALLDRNSKRMANVTATQRSILAVLRREDFESLMTEDIHLGFTLMHNIAKILSMRLGKANQDIIKLTIAFSLALEK